MSNSPWLDRFQAVARAQSRYLYLLLILCAFFWALRGRIAGTHDNSHVRLPIVDLEIEGLVILTIAPIVIAFVLLALLGTLSALGHAQRQLESLGAPFEALDTVPTLIDFVVYARSDKRSSRLALLSYPVALTLAYAEAAWLWVESLAYVIVARYVAYALGLLLLLCCLPRLISLWRSKTAAMLAGER